MKLLHDTGLKVNHLSNPYITWLTAPCDLQEEQQIVNSNPAWYFSSFCGLDWMSSISDSKIQWTFMNGLFLISRKLVKI
jgi:hypothetical protein